MASAELVKEVGDQKLRDALLVKKTLKFSTLSLRPVFAAASILTETTKDNAKDAKVLEYGITSKRHVPVPTTSFGLIKLSNVNALFQAK